VTAAIRHRIEAAIVPLHGWTTPEKGARLAELVIETEAALSVEIGVFGGRGSIAMAIGHEALQKGVVVGIDPWDVAASLDGENAPANDDWWRQIDHEDVYARFLGALLQHRLTRYCRVMRERSDTALRLFGDGSVSVLHQDGNHSEKVSCAEVEMWTPKIRSRGYWVADDADWPTTQRALGMLAGRGFDLVEDHGGWRVYRKP
jgi:hypothetical protein